MQDKKIITRKDVKENNPNDDEEILKNINPEPHADSENIEKDKSENIQDRSDGSETLGIP